MQNGDRYVGKVLLLNADTLVVDSDVLGRVQLPRGKVALITLGSTAPANRAPPTLGHEHTYRRSISAAITNANAEISAALRQLGAHTNLIQQVQKQFLGDAGPEANDKFNELLGGLMSGKLNINDLRNEARSAADQLRSLKRDLGEDSGWAVDSYLSILDHFVKDSAPPGSAATNAPATAPKPKV